MARPAIQEKVPELFPMSMQVMRVDVGATAGDVLITSSAVYNLMDIPVGIYIHDVAVQVTTAFNANVDLALGNSTGTAQWFAVGDIDATAAGTNLKSAKGLAHAHSVVGDTTVALPAFAGPGYLKLSGDDTSGGAGLALLVETTPATTGAMSVLVFYTHALSTGAASAAYGARFDKRQIKQFRPGL